nr:helix-turn-helix domain-containing protein [Bradyrhizobium acaciae]
MLRRVSIDNASVTEASNEYGVSRPTYYQAKASFDAAGIAGLVPKKPGPRGPHKVQGEVLAFLQARLVPGEPVRARELASLVRAELGIEVHPRTIERALKKLPDEHATTPACSILSPAIAAQYEVLRMAALGEALPPTARSGLMLFLRRGMWGWAQTLAAAAPVQQSVASRTPPVPRNEHTAVVYVLATMAMSTPERRTP